MKDDEIVNRRYLVEQVQSYLLKRGINLLLFCEEDGVALQGNAIEESYYCAKCGRKWWWRGDVSMPPGHRRTGPRSK